MNDGSITAQRRARSSAQLARGRDRLRADAVRQRRVGARRRGPSPTPDRLCDAHLVGHYHLSVVDVHDDLAGTVGGRHPGGADARQATCRCRCAVVGDLSQTDPVLSASTCPDASRVPAGSEPEPRATDSCECVDLGRLDRRRRRSDVDATRQHGRQDADAVELRMARQRTRCGRSPPARSMRSSSPTARPASGSSRWPPPIGRTGCSSRTCATAQRRCRPTGSILYANRRLAELLSVHARDDRRIAARPVRRRRPPPSLIDDRRGPDGARRHARARPHRRRRRAPSPSWSALSPLDVDGDRLDLPHLHRPQRRRRPRTARSPSSAGPGPALADLQDAQAALTQQATHDALTGLPNRALLVERIDQALAQARRSAASTARAVHRPRPLQAGQRHPAATRPATWCCARSPTSCVAGCGRWTPWRASAATSSSCWRPTSTAASTPSTSATRAAHGARPPLRDRRRGRRARCGERRDLGVGRRHGVRRRPCSTRPTRRCTGPSRSAGAGSRSSTPRSAARSSSDRSPSERPPVGARRPPGRRPLPTDRRPRHRQRRRLRGARPDRPRRRHDAAPGGIHPGGRGERAGRARSAPQVLAMACQEAHRWPLSARRPPADRRRQPVRPPVRTGRPTGARAPLRRGRRPGAGVPPPRAHRDGDHRPAPRHPPAAGPRPRPGRRDRPRRLRHRLRLAHPPAPAAADLREDRPLVRARPRDRQG